MKEARETRRLNMEALTREYGSLRALAERVKTSERYLSQIRNATGHMGAAVARKFETELGKPTGWMDTSHSSEHQETKKRAATADEMLRDFIHMDPDEQAKFMEHVQAVAKTKHEIVRRLMTTQRIVDGEAEPGWRRKEHKK
jgi:hypothetical protein